LLLIIDDTSLQTPLIAYLLILTALLPLSAKEIKTIEKANTYQQPDSLRFQMAIELPSRVHISRSNNRTLNGGLERLLFEEYTISLPIRLIQVQRMGL
jgi:hypothetical protein